jgi:sugar phosphate isomerase/epimerase
MRLSYVVYEPVPDLVELTARMARLAEFGYEGIELHATDPLGFAVDDLAAAADHAGLPVVSLMTGWAYANEGVCLSSPDPDIRDRAVARLVADVELAARLDALIVVGLLQGLRSDEPDPAVADVRIVDALRRVARVAEERRVTIVIEPVNHLQVGFNHTAAEVVGLIDRVDSPAVSLMLDTIHMNIEERSVVGTIRDHADRLRHVHLAETNGGLFGTAHLDFPAVLAELDAVGYDRFVSVKIYRTPSWEVAARSAIEFVRAIPPAGRGAP